MHRESLPGCGLYMVHTKKCNSKYSWKICMDHIAVMELLAIIAEKNPFTYYEQYLFHLSISHIQKCHSNISKIALVAIFLPIWSISSVRASVSSLTEPFMGPSHEYKVRIRDYHFTNQIAYSLFQAGSSLLHWYTVFIPDQNSKSYL